MDSYDYSPFRFWPDGLTEPLIDALLAEAGIEVESANGLRLVEGLEQDSSRPMDAGEQPPSASTPAA